MLLRFSVLQGGSKKRTHSTTLGGCAGNRLYERDWITELYRVLIPLITSEKKKHCFKLDYE